ncbi:MAG: histidine kinase, partial [Desulfobacterium sp.]|nr:histidine kinase [Desulfobacterium sp.]
MAYKDESTGPMEQDWSLKSLPDYKPVLILAAAIVFIALAIMPPTQAMLDMVAKEYPSGYPLGENCKTIIDTVNQKLRPEAFKAAQNDQIAVRREHSKEVSQNHQTLLNAAQVARMAKMMVLILFLSAFLWSTEALPIGATDMLVAVLLYLFAVLPINDISKAYMSDAVFFVFGILTVAVGVTKTGLDKRIGLILLSRIRSTKAFAFIFLPMLSMAASFLSEHALVALLIPVLMGVYKVTCKMNGVDKDPALGVFLLLGLTFAANVGGPGSPAAGGRNAIMVGFLMDYGAPISFLQWMKTGMAFVPVMSCVIGAYMYIRCKPRFRVPEMDPGEVVRAEVARMPKFGGKEAVMAVILTLLVAAWLIIGEHAGLGGPTLCAVMAMFLARILTWEDVHEGVAFDVVGLYAAASAIGVGLKVSGGGLWLASALVDFLPGFLSSGEGLIMGVSLLTGVMTNFMRDSATVAALGPVVLPMATLAGVSIWKMGLACVFSSSFANILVVSTPNNAICFGMGRDPETGERLLNVMDFVKFGLPITVLSWLVLWGWTIFGYWRFLEW